MKYPRVGKSFKMEDLEAGWVVRADWKTLDAGFEDMVVCQNNREKKQVLFARPYMYAILSETTCPGYLIGAEEFWAPYRDDVTYTVKATRYKK